LIEFIIFLSKQKSILFVEEKKLKTVVIRRVKEKRFFTYIRNDWNRRMVKDIVLVVWKPPTAPWLKVNTNGSVIGGYAACGGLFRDHSGTFRGAFVCNIGTQSVFYAEVMAIIFAIEYAVHHGWRNIWLESNSTSALRIFSNALLVPILLRNRWHNACNLGIQVISSHIFREGNCCADYLTNLGHSVVGAI